VWEVVGGGLAFGFEPGSWRWLIQLWHGGVLTIRSFVPGHGDGRGFVCDNSIRQFFMAH
jgi:hypothetical protein